MLKQDRLSAIFDMQQQLNEDIRCKRNLTDLPREQWIQKQTLAMLSEMAELLDEVNFKWWKNPRPVNEDALKNELVDILHFFVSMCLEAGMSPQELYERYLSKNRVNMDRQLGLTDNPDYKA